MLTSGEVFAGYTVERLLGQGGMGSVYLARHPRFSRQTALKLLNTDLFTDAEVRARFEREADLVAQLDHPGIVAVYDRGSENGQLWIAMQYVDGVDAAAVNPMTLPPERAVQIIEGVAEALDYAHGRGVLHRDVKPANIMLARSSGGQGERVFLTDFGLARLREESTHLTQTGMFTATLAYAAPEQMTGGHLDPRTDQYGLACALYWLLAGVGPFDADNPADIIKGHLQLALPPLAVRRRGLNPALDAVLAAGMAKRPEYRYETCAEFAAAARHALTTTSGARLPAPRYAGSPPAAPPGMYPPAVQQIPGAPAGYRGPYPAPPVAAPVPPTVPQMPPQPPPAQPPLAPGQSVPPPRAPMPQQGHPLPPPPVPPMPAPDGSPVFAPPPQMYTHDGTAAPSSQMPAPGTSPAPAPAPQIASHDSTVALSTRMPPHGDTASPGASPHPPVHDGTPPVPHRPVDDGTPAPVPPRPTPVHDTSAAPASTPPLTSAHDGTAAPSSQIPVPGDAASPAPPPQPAVHGGTPSSPDMSAHGGSAAPASVGSEPVGVEKTSAAVPGARSQAAPEAPVSEGGAAGSGSAGPRQSEAAPVTAAESASATSDHAGARRGPSSLDEHTTSGGVAVAHRVEPIPATPAPSASEGNETRGEQANRAEGGAVESSGPGPVAGGRPPVSLGKSGPDVETTGGAERAAAAGTFVPTGPAQARPPGPGTVPGRPTGVEDTGASIRPPTGAGPPPVRPVAAPGRSRRFGPAAIVIVALLSILVLVFVAMVVVLAVGADPDEQSAAEPAPPPPPTSAVTGPRAAGPAPAPEGVAASRLAFPELLPQTPGTAGVGYQGADCAVFRPTDGFQPQEESLRTGRWTIAWRCVRAINDPSRLSYTIFGYESPAAARLAAAALPADREIPDMRDGVPHTRHTWTDAPAGPSGTATAKMVVSFENDPVRAGYLLYVSHSSGPRFPFATEPTADLDIADWWARVPL